MPNTNANNVNKAMNDIMKFSLLRHDDIGMLRQLLKSLYLKTEQMNKTNGSG